MKSDGRFFKTIITSLLLVASYTAVAEQDSIVVDANGNYVITYKSYLGWQRVKWIPATKINPAINTVVRRTRTNPDQFSYRYTVRNGQDSRQYLVGMRTQASDMLSTDPDKPGGWTADATVDHATGSGFIVGWSFWRGEGPWEAGLKPGISISGFGIDSKDLPGVGKFALWAAVPPGQSFPDEGPNEEYNPTIIKEFNRIIDYDYVPRLATVPRIEVPSPFDAAVVLAGIRKHLMEELVPMKLVEPVFAEGFGRLLEAAIEAAKRGNTAGLLAHLKDLRRMLRGFGEPEEENHAANKNGDIPEDQINTKLWPHPVAKLAARVLDFDLKYVLERIKG